MLIEQYNFICNEIDNACLLNKEKINLHITANDEVFLLSAKIKPFSLPEDIMCHVIYSGNNFSIDFIGKWNEISEIISQHVD